MAISQKNVMKIVREEKSIHFSSLYNKLKKENPRFKKVKLRRILSKLVNKSKIFYSNGGNIIELLTGKSDGRSRKDSRRSLYSPEKDFDIIVKKHKITTEFSQNAKSQAIDLKNKEVILTEDRTDFTHQNVITIDGEDAKDFDDAVYVEKTKEGGFVLYVHIADVSHYIKEGSTLDKEAYKRGNSFYLVDNVVPMLPKSLSNGLCSLNPNVKRYVVSVRMNIDSAGRVTDREFYTGVITSKRRCTYKEVEHAINSNKNDLPQDIQNIYDMLMNMKELALILMRKRRSEGSLELETKELKIKVDQNSKPIEIGIIKRLFSNQIIEEFMLIANVTVSKHLEKYEESIFRVHEEPDPDKMESLNQTMYKYGIKVENRNGTFSEIINDMLRQVKEREDKNVIHLNILKTMNQAVYSTVNLGHFGLGFDSYTHFTSPIRRYPDLVVHRLLKNRMGKKIKAPRCLHIEYLKGVCETSSKTERVAVDAERDIIKRKSAHFMVDKINEEYDGVISGIAVFGFFVEIIPYGVEGLCSLKDLEFRYELDEKNNTLYSISKGIKFELGKKVRVKVANVNTKKSFIDLIPIDEESYPVKN